MSLVAGGFLILPFAGIVKTFTGFPYLPIVFDFILLLSLLFFFSKKPVLDIGAIHYAVFLLFLMAIIWIFHPYESDILFKIKGFRTSGFYMIAFFIPLFHTKSPVFLNHLMKLNLTVGSVVCAYAIRQFYFPFAFEESYALLAGTATTFLGDTYDRVHGVFRVFGSFSASTHLAAYCTWIFLIAFCSLVFRASNMRLSLIAASLSGFVLALTFSRTAILALAATLPVVAYILGRARGAIRGTITGLSLSIVLLSLGVLAAAFVPMFMERLLSIGSLGQVSSLATRLGLWQERLTEIAVAPMGYGTGVAGFHDVDRYLLIADSQYLKVFIEWGWVGGGLFILILLMLALKLVRSVSPHFEKESLILRVSSVGFLATMSITFITNQILEAFPINLIFWYICGLAYSDARTRRTRFIALQTRKHPKVESSQTVERGNVVLDCG